jgi:hypothetical protein
LIVFEEFGESHGVKITYDGLLTSDELCGRRFVGLSTAQRRASAGARRRLRITMNIDSRAPLRARVLRLG